MVLDSTAMMASFGVAKNTNWRASSMRRSLKRGALFVNWLTDNYLSSSCLRSDILHEYGLTKTQSLNHQVYNFDKCIKPECKTEMCWWLPEGISSTKPGSIPKPHFSLTTDFSTLGYGAHSAIQTLVGVFGPTQTNKCTSML